MYTTERYKAQISVDDYLKDYVDVETFLKCCKECPNYDTVWSCPSYDFDVIEYWKKYQTLDLTAVKIIYDEEYAGKEFPQEEIRRIIDDSVFQVKRKLTEELMAKEEECPGSVSLSAGHCNICEEPCPRKAGKPCRHPDKMRYSVESLGGNVGLTLSKLMGIELEWIEEGRLPRHFVLVCGLLH